MKKTFIMLLSFVLTASLLLSVPILAYAGESVASSKETTTGTTEEQEQVVASRLETRNLGTLEEAIVLYSHDDLPKYILALSESGYLISDVDTGEVIEWGEDQNPYAGYEETILYYGGFGLYYSWSNEGFYNLIDNITVPQMGYMPVLEEMAVSYGAQPDQGLLDTTADTLTDYPRTVLLPSYQSNILKLSFGKNFLGDELMNTCTAVATAQALNYLDQSRANAIVPEYLESEPLDGNGWESKYENTLALQKNLVYDCGLGPRSFGAAVRQAVYLYSASTGGIAIEVDWMINVDAGATFEYVAHEIDNRFPSMITTTINSGTDEESSLDWHTMVVLGYSVDSEGSASLALHNGWYGDKYISTVGTVSTHKITWVNPSIASFAYRFNLELGWKTLSDGTRKFYDPHFGLWKGWLDWTSEDGVYGMYYFDENGIMLTGWQKLYYNSDDPTGYNWYYFGDDGRARIGWLDWNGNRYAFGASGGMLTGRHYYMNGYYFFSTDEATEGQLLSGWINTSTTSTPEWHYYSPATFIEASGWLQLGGERYYLDPLYDHIRASGMHVLAPDGSNPAYSDFDANGKWLRYSATQSTWD